LEREWLERERLERERSDREITINIFRWEDVAWKYLMRLTVDPENPSNVEELVNDYMDTGSRTCTTDLRMVSPEECFQAVLNNRTHTILLIAEDELVIDDRMLESARKLHDEAIKRVLGLKRTATDDLSFSNHPRKMRTVAITLKDGSLVTLLMLESNCLCIFGPVLIAIIKLLGHYVPVLWATGISGRREDGENH
jgi:hypothetical protein